MGFYSDYRLYVIVARHPFTASRYSTNTMSCQSIPTLHRDTVYKPSFTLQLIGKGEIVVSVM